jgi:hypothetical protein
MILVDELINVTPLIMNIWESKEIELLNKYVILCYNFMVSKS